MFWAENARHSYHLSFVPTRGCAGVRARAWGGVAVVGRNQGERVKGAVGPSPGGLPPVRDGQRRRRGQGRWVVVAPAKGHEDVGGMLGRSICPAEILNGEIQRNGIF